MILIAVAAFESSGLSFFLRLPTGGHRKDWSDAILLLFALNLLAIGPLCIALWIRDLIRLK
jgi:hypothetical protein